MAEFSPIGILTAVDEAQRAYGRGDYGGAALAALGAVRAGKGGKAIGKGLKSAFNLPMDQASRIARAKAMGFNIDRPVYHGTGTSFLEFDPTKAGLSTGALSARTGIWLTPDPRQAKKYADKAVRIVGGNSQIYPLFYRSESPGIIKLDGTESEAAITATIMNAFYDTLSRKSDSIRFLLPSGSETIVIRDPEQVRSMFARFDPTKMSSRDILAALIGVGAIGVLSDEMAHRGGMHDGT